ncbi:MAG: pilus assembly protein PilM [Acetivibrio sp.]
MRRVLSIEIGTEYTKVCEIDYQKKNPKVYNFLSFETPQNTVEDGYIRDKESFSLELKRQLKEAGMKGKDVIYTISSSKIANREIIIPAVKEKKIREIIEIGAQDYFPVDISEYTITYSILERKKVEKVENLRLLLMAAPDNLIKNYYNFSEIMEFHVVAIDYIGNSIYQLAKREFPHEVIMAVQVNEKSTLVNVMDNGILVLQRTIPYGSEDALDKELAATLVQEENDFMQDTDLRERVAEALDSILNSIGRVTDYYYSQHLDKPIKELVLMGDLVNIKNINLIISEKLAIPSKLLKSLNHKIFLKKETPFQISEYMACIGASYEPVNFLSKDIAAKAARKSMVGSMQIVFGIALLLSITLDGFAVMQYWQEKERKADVEGQIQELSSVKQIYDENTKAKTRYEQLKKYEERIQSPNDNLDALIVKMEQVLPRTAHISSMQVDRETLVFGVETTQKLPIAKMIMNFKEIPEITNIYVPAITSQIEENGAENLTYTLTCEYVKTVPEKKEEVKNSNE